MFKIVTRDNLGLNLLAGTRVFALAVWGFPRNEHGDQSIFDFSFTLAEDTKVCHTLEDLWAAYVNECEKREVSPRESYVYEGIKLHKCPWGECNFDVEIKLFAE